MKLSKVSNFKRIIRIILSPDRYTLHKLIFLFHDLLLSCRQSMSRHPDDYSYEIDAFLCLSEEDIISYELPYEKNKEFKNDRIIVKCNTMNYEIDKYCPHEYADLTYAEITKDGRVICPRHCWEFNLINNGICEKIKKYSINSKKITGNKK